MGRWDAAKAIVTAYADDILAFVKTSDPTCPLASLQRRHYPATVLDRVSGRLIADRGTLSISWDGRTCYLGFTLPFQLFEALACRPNRYIKTRSSIRTTRRFYVKVQLELLEAVRKTVEDTVS